jgi:Cellulase (glycosyl hydrolase family 5)
MRSIAAIWLAAVVLGGAAAQASAAPLELGIQDDDVFVREPGTSPSKLISRDAAYAAVAKLSVRVVRINVIWNHVAGIDKRDPWDWSHYDAAVDAALSHGVEPELTLTGPAPAWATGNGKRGVFRPRPALFAEFATAAATRYAGRVKRYSIWNEPNWPSWLAPKSAQPSIYRDLYRAGYDAIRGVDPSAEVLIGELAPMGPPEAAMPPLTFLRRLTCSDARWRRASTCPALVADGFAHHPYVLRWAPEYPGPSRDDVTIGSLGRLDGALRALASRHALATAAGSPLPLYLTEFGYHANSRTIDERKRATFSRRAYEIAARDKHVRQLVWYQLAAPPPRRKRQWDTSLLRTDGTPTPTYTALVQWVIAAVKAGRVMRIPPG